MDGWFLNLEHFRDIIIVFVVICMYICWYGIINVTADVNLTLTNSLSRDGISYDISNEDSYSDFKDNTYVYFHMHIYKHGHTWGLLLYFIFFFLSFLQM